MLLLAFISFCIIAGVWAALLFLAAAAAFIHLFVCQR